MFSEKASRNHSGFQAPRSLLQPFNGGSVAPKQPQTVQRWMGTALFQYLCFKTGQAWLNPFFCQQLFSPQDLLQRQVFNVGSLGSRFLNSLKSFTKCCLRVFLFVWAFFCLFVCFSGGRAHSSHQNLNGSVTQKTVRPEIPLCKSPHAHSIVSYFSHG